MIQQTIQVVKHNSAWVAIVVACIGALGIIIAAWIKGRKK
jgi:hypothetical protein